MELIKHATDWVNGEVFQGKIMLALGSLILIAGIVLMSKEHQLLNGMLIPIGLIVFVLIGYGGMQVIVRPKHLQTVTEVYKSNPNLAVEKEYNKSRKDDKLFKVLKIIWPIGMVISIGLYFIFSKPYLQGFSIGLLGLFVTLYILDSFLHHRLKVYLHGLDSLL